MSRIKQAVSERWVAQRAANALKQGVKPERMLNARRAASKRGFPTSYGNDVTKAQRGATKNLTLADSLRKGRQAQLATGTGAKSMVPKVDAARVQGQANRTMSNITRGRINTVPKRDMGEALEMAEGSALARAGKLKTAMDHELATAVISRYQSGLPVDETMFFKAAHAIGANPSDALLEARWETLLHHDLPKLASGARLSPQALSLYSAAAGEDPRALTKTASRYRMDPQRLVMLKLAENN